MSASPHMEDRNVPKSNAADVLGFIGLAFAVLGMADTPLLCRFSCLFGACIFLPVSFHRQIEWPAWVRWVFSMIVISMITYVAWTAISDR
ncbi:MAG: hypothetical protein JST28_10975 [Acidobacteria bacterium]|nr:hypothetical protein [Acidobacteriota bacterium]